MSDIGVFWRSLISVFATVIVSAAVRTVTALSVSLSIMPETTLPSRRVTR